MLKTLLDIMDEKLHPIAYYFDAVESHSIFIEDVNSLTNGEGGRSIEGIIDCTFPCQLDEFQIYNSGFDGIQFIFFEEEIVVDVPTFRKYLRIACEAYWTQYPESRATLEEYLARPQPPLEEGALNDWKTLRDAGKYAKPFSEVTE